VARKLFTAADTAQAGSRGRLTAREIVRYASRKARRDRRFTQRELDRMLNLLGVRRPGGPPLLGPPSQPPPALPPGTAPLPTLPSAPTLPSGPGPSAPTLPPPPPQGPQPTPEPSSTPTPSPDPDPTFEPIPMEGAVNGVFDAFDSNENGIVNGDDYNLGQPLLRLMGVETANRTQVAGFIATRYDTNTNGLIDREEYERLIAELFAGGDPVEVVGHNVHDLFDSDGSCIVDANDDNGGAPLLGLMGAVTADLAQVTAFVAARYDTNANGWIYQEEYDRLVNELGVAPVGPVTPGCAAQPRSA
jgi:hypothetical protein